MTGPSTQNLTILLSDIKGFTDKTARKTRSDILAMLAKHKEIVLPILESMGGRLVKTIGDAFLVVFDSPTDAVLAGIAVQQALSEYNEGKESDDRIDVRIAINVGEVTLADNDIFGDAVNITSRVEGIAEAGEVYFTEAVYLAMNKKEVPSSEIGLRKFKGIPDEIRVYKVLKEHPVEELPDTGDQPTTLKRGLLGLLRGKAARKMDSAGQPAFELPKLTKAHIFRRTVAIIIDAVICSLLLGIFVTKDKTEYRVSKKDAGPSFGRKLNEAGKRLLSAEQEKQEESLASLSSATVTIQGEFAIKDALLNLSKQGGFDLVLDPDVKGRVTLNLTDVPLRRAVELLLHREELTAEPEEGGALRVRYAVWKRMKNRLRGGVRIDEEGLSLGKDVRLDDKGLKVGDDLEITEETVKLPGLFETKVKEEPLEEWTEEKGEDGRKRRKRKVRKTKTVRIGPGASDEEVLEDETLYEADGTKVRRVRKKNEKAFPIFWVIYSTFFLAIWGATPGKKILKLKVVQADSGAPIDWKLALVRSLFTVLSASVCMLGFIWALGQREGRAWHDLIAGTIVVPAPPKG